MYSRIRANQGIVVRTRPAMAYLKIHLPDGVVHRHELTGPVVIGRSADCDIWLPDTHLSRRHCTILPEQDGWALVDLDSRNGTFVGLNRIQRHQLLDGNMLRVGRCRMMFYAVGHAVDRPRSPDESLFAARVDNELHHKDRPPTSGLPTPYPKPMPLIADPSASTGSDTLGMSADDRSLPFSRPPARPVVKPSDGNT